VAIKSTIGKWFRILVPPRAALMFGCSYFCAQPSLAAEKPNDCSFARRIGDVITITGTYEGIWYKVFVDEEPNCVVRLEKIIPKTGSKVKHFSTYTGPTSVEEDHDDKNWKSSTENMVELSKEQVAKMSSKLQHLQDDDHVQIQGRLCYFEEVLENPGNVRHDFIQFPLSHYFISLEDATIVKLKKVKKSAL
jgi:hypothetical protein